MARKKELKSINEYISKALNNIDTDRASAHSLLTDLMILLKKQPIMHDKHGLTAAKYLETLQRSNEQLVKVIELMRKNKERTEEFGEEDVEDVYDKIQEEE